MEVKLNLTEDEYHWLKTVSCWGSEVTEYLGRSGYVPEFQGERDWKEIQYVLYLKISEIGLKETEPLPENDTNGKFEGEL